MKDAELSRSAATTLNVTALIRIRCCKNTQGPPVNYVRDSGRQSTQGLRLVLVDYAVAFPIMLFVHGTRSEYALM